MKRDRVLVVALVLSSGIAASAACSSGSSDDPGADGGADGAADAAREGSATADGSTDASRDGSATDATTTTDAAADAVRDGSGDGSRDGSGDGSRDGSNDGASSDGSSDATTGDGGTTADGSTDAGDDGASAQVDRGRYLVQNLLVCADCHTPMNNMGMPDVTKLMAGGMDFPIPSADGGLDHVYAGNLTSDMTTGIGAWTVAELKTAMTQGLDRQGNALHPIMPYHELGNMTDADATAIAMYLKSIPAITNAVPASTVQLPAPEPVFPESSIPHTTLAQNDPDFQKAEDGRYLAKLVCLHCHTPDLDQAGPPVTDLTRAFGGGRAFQLGPSFLSVSANITPHPTKGLGSWTTVELENTMKTYLKKGTGTALCAPMPGAFAGLTASDITNIATFIHTLPEVDNDAPGMCPSF
ncbi:MAG: hypothetical protein U0169_23005 [Polyangiaceae bacterium]